VDDVINRHRLGQIDPGSRLEERNMKIRRIVLAASLLYALLVVAPTIAVAAVDPYPNGCVSCHVVDKAKGVDRRLSVALAKWNAGKIDAGLLAKAKASAPAGLALKGKHPSAEDSLESIPEGCLDCHSADSKKAPPFSRLLHLVHLTGGATNSYVTTFKSDCMNCHKLGTQTGEWSMPSGPEK
jgi:nitrate reductase cytochrome c-type subunit